MLKNRALFLSLLFTGTLAIACGGSDDGASDSDPAGGDGDGDGDLMGPGDGDGDLMGPGDGDGDTPPVTTGCQQFEMSAPPDGITLLHENVQGTFESTTRVLRFDGENRTMLLDENAMWWELSLDDGSVTEVGPAPEGNYSLVGDLIIFSEQDLSGEEDFILRTVAPINDQANTVEMAATPLGYSTYYGSTGLYFEERDPAGIWFASYEGGAKTEFVPGANPQGMVEWEGYLYWTDFLTDQLERVAVGGGDREQLAEIFFGGPMTAGHDQIFLYDTSLNALQRWIPGATSMETLWSGGVFDDVGSVESFAGGAYFLVPDTCTTLYQATSADDLATFASGFEGSFTGGAAIVGSDADFLYVIDQNGIYKVARN